MIISASRRTDIPAFYGDWFYNRIREGFLYVRNPYNRHLIYRIDLSPDQIDCLVFWTKNPRPFIARLHELEAYTYYFQFTVNPYDARFEPHVPSLEESVRTFRELSELIGKERVIWRYDPILYADQVGYDYHVHHFGQLMRLLAPYTRTCVISFLDPYRKWKRGEGGHLIRELTDTEIRELVSRLAPLEAEYGIKLQTCAEPIDLSSWQVYPGSCVDSNLIETLTGRRLKTRKDPYQRPACGCSESIDIGEYQTCPHGCLYCYANNNPHEVTRRFNRHDPLSPLLIGHVDLDDLIKVRQESR